MAINRGHKKPPGTRKSVPGTLAADATPPLLKRFRRDFHWEHTEVEPYKIAANDIGEFAGASRQVLIGKGGERVAFHLRYFELEPKGYTSLERHRHAHVVIGVRGRGLVRIGDREYPLAPHDLVYIGSEQAHQLRTTGRSKFGFFCIVNARRDKPRPVRLAESRPRRHGAPKAEA